MQEILQIQQICQLMHTALTMPFKIYCTLKLYWKPNARLRGEILQLKPLSQNVTCKIILPDNHVL